MVPLAGIYFRVNSLVQYPASIDRRSHGKRGCITIMCDRRVECLGSFAVFSKVEVLSNSIGKCERIHWTAVPLNYAPSFSSKFNIKAIHSTLLIHQRLGSAHRTSYGWSNNRNHCYSCYIRCLIYRRCSSMSITFPPSGLACKVWCTLWIHWLNPWNWEIVKSRLLLKFPNGGYFC